METNIDYGIAYIVSTVLFIRIYVYMCKFWNISHDVKHHNVCLLTSMCILVEHLSLTTTSFNIKGARKCIEKHLAIVLYS